jgi:hypothetical protein
MTWDDVLDRLTDAGLKPIEDTYMENYGKLLAAERPEFQDRVIRCTYGRIRCAGPDLFLEVFLFPSESHVEDFLELMKADTSWLAYDNAAVHFPNCDSSIVEKVLRGLSREDSIH